MTGNSGKSPSVGFTEMTEVEITRRAAEIIKAWRVGSLAAHGHPISVAELKEAALWRIACTLAEVGASVETAYAELKNSRLN